MSQFAPYRLKHAVELRPYVKQEGGPNIIVQAKDLAEFYSSNAKGMIARDPTNPDYQWYVSNADFEANYAPADEMVLVRKADLEELEDDSLLLNCLRNAGVDNWDWYGDALEDYNSQKES